LLRKITRSLGPGTFKPKRDEVTGGSRKLHNEELHNLYSSPSIIRMIKSKMMGWAGHVSRMGEKMVWIGLIWLMIGTSGGLL
jgi:hypothetical protein